MQLWMIDAIHFIICWIVTFVGMTAGLIAFTCMFIAHLSKRRT